MIIEFKKYILYNTKWDWNESINEKKGIPDTIKSYVNIIYNNIKFPETEYFININESDLRLKNLKIELENKKINNYYSYFIYDGINKDLINPLIHIEFNFDNSLNSIELKRIITHELLHLYETYQRCKDGNINGLQWDLLNKIQQLRKKYSDKLISDLCLMIYFSADHELNAIVAQMYPILMSYNSNDKNVLLIELGKNKSWLIYRQLMEFNIEDYSINYDLCIKFFTELNSIMKKISLKNFKIFQIPKSNDDINNLLNKFIRLFRHKGKYLKSKLIKIVDEVIKDIKENPIIEKELCIDKFKK